MVDNHNRDLLSKAVEDFEQFLSDSGGKSFEWFIAQQQSDVARQRAGDGDHLLHAPGQIVSRCIPAYRQPRKDLDNALVSPTNPASPRAFEPSEHQIVGNW